MFDIQNDLGQIHFSRNVIYRICHDAAELWEGNVRILHYKGRYSTKRPGRLNSLGSSAEEEADAIEIHEGEDGMAITVYIVVRFGISMRQAADVMTDHIYRQMQQLFGCRPRQVTIIVTGTASKTIARRHIEFVR